MFFGRTHKDFTFMTSKDMHMHIWIDLSGIEVCSVFSVET